MSAALRSAVLRHTRIAVRTPASTLSQLLRDRPFQSTSARSMSSHEEHLEREDVVERVLSVVKSFPKVDPSKVTPDAHFQKDLGLDSLDNVEIVMGIEEEFKLEIPDKEADKIDSCGVAIEYVHSHPMAG